MPHTKLQDIPTKQNTAVEPEQVVFYPKFAQPKALGEVFGISTSTVRRYLKQWEDDNKGVQDLYFYLSPTLKVINIQKFEEYFKKCNKEWL
ncbi:transposase family protein [Staphylococcus sp. Marseille-Q6910]|uniref:transposase family protein n=1 Tax=Staphylococcus sp. Marseille-Q6910 TaxID=2937990 RepID=UPI00203C3D88|nr:transposase family protein [Staphylococcus sp. Marseille-Q6910]